MKIDPDEAWMLEYYRTEVTEYVKETSRKAFDGFVPVLQEANKFMMNTEGRQVVVDGLRYLIKDEVWEGRNNATGTVHRFNPSVLAEEVKQFYLLSKTEGEGADNAFVAIAKDMNGPTVPLEDDLPVVSV
jgi:hypothetical protein